MFDVQCVVGYTTLYFGSLTLAMFHANQVRLYATCEDDRGLDHEIFAKA